MTNFEKVGVFMKTFGQEVKLKSELSNDKINKLRIDLIEETLKNNKTFHSRPEIIFNFEKQHWCCCFTKNIIEDYEVVQEKMGLKLTRVFISFK